MTIATTSIRLAMAGVLALFLTSCEEDSADGMPVVSVEQPSSPPVVSPTPVPTSTPTPTPPKLAIPVADIRLVSEGDSNSIFWTGNHTGIFASKHPELQFFGRAVGGSGLGSPDHRGTDVNSAWGRLDATLELKPTHLTILIGGNDMTDWRDVQNGTTDPAAWLGRLFSYTDVLREAGVRVAVATLLPKCVAARNLAFDSLYKERRAAVNSAIRSAVGSRIDAVIDFAADPRFGDDEDACDTAIYHDGVHVTSATQQKLAEVYEPAVIALLRH